MIILITGASHTGKTVLAQKMHSYDYSDNRCIAYRQNGACAKNAREIWIEV